MPVAGDQIHHTFGHARLSEQLVDQQRRQRRLLRGFDHTAAAGGQGRCQLGTRVEHRTIPRKDQPDDAIGLFEGVAVHVGEDAGDATGLLHVVGNAVELGAPTAVVTEDLRTGAHDCAGLHQRHTRILRIDFGERVGVFIDQIGNAPENLGPLRPGKPLPHAGFETGTCAGYRFVDCCRAAVREFADLLLAGRIDDRDGLAGARTLSDLVEHCLKCHLLQPLSLISSEGLELRGAVELDV